MRATAEPIVLVAREGALLSVVCARLTMAGDTPITAGDCNDPQLGPSLRSNAILVVEGGGVSSEPAETVRALRAMGWCGKLAIIVEAVPQGDPPAGVHWVAKGGGTRAIMTAIAAFRS